MSDLHSLTRAARDVLGHGRAVAFWVAVVSPFVYLPLALVGLPTLSDQLFFAGLVVLHAVALYAGHPYKDPGSTPAESGAQDRESDTRDGQREVRA